MCWCGKSWSRAGRAFRLGGPTMDGLTRRRGNGLVRLLHVDGAPVVVAVSGTVFAARAATEAAAREGIARMRFATGIDDDLEDFHARFRDDPVLGRAIRARPWLRVRRNPDAVRGAHLGDHRAADRARPRQGHPAPPDRRPRPALRRPARRPGRRDGRGLGARGDRRLRPGPEAHPRAPLGRARSGGGASRARARGDAGGDARAGPRPPRRATPRRATPGQRATPRRASPPPRGRRSSPARAGRLRAAARHPRDRDVDGRVPRPVRARAARRRARGRSGLSQARRAALDGQPARHRRRGRGARVLLRLRAVRGHGGAVPQRSREDSPSPSPGRNSLVSGLASEGGRVSRFSARIQRS